MDKLVARNPQHFNLLSTFKEKLLLLGYLSRLIFMIFQSCCIDLKVKGITRTFKDRHSSDINNVFWGFRINTKNIDLHKYFLSHPL